MVGTPQRHCGCRNHTEIGGRPTSCGHTGMDGSGKVRARLPRVATDSKRSDPEFLGTGLSQSLHERGGEFGTGVAAHAVGAETERHDTIIGCSTPIQADCPVG